MSYNDDGRKTSQWKHLPRLLLSSALPSTSDSGEREQDVLDDNTSFPETSKSDLSDVDTDDDSVQSARRESASEHSGSWVESYARSLDFNRSSIEVPVKRGHRRNSSVRLRASLFDPLQVQSSSDQHIWALTPATPKTPFSASERQSLRSKHSRYSSVASTPRLSTIPELPSEEQHKNFGQSSLSQTTFNAINLFIGVGLLSMPYTFRVGGLVLGPLILLMCAWLSHYTARILIKSMDARPGIQNYSDLGEAAFGRWGRWFITIVFFFELFSCACVYVVLVGDTLFEIMPHVAVFGWQLGKTGLQLAAFFLVMLPTSLVSSLKILSVGSLIGIAGSLTLGLVLVVDAFGKPEAPGSIYHPAAMDMWPSSLRMWMLLPLNASVIMYNYSGGAVMPNLYRDMRNPKQFSRMLNTTFAVVTGWFLLITGLSYWMFGVETKHEIFQNIAQEPAYSRSLTMLLLWMMVLNPLTKFALMLNPVCVNLELILLRPLLLHTLNSKTNEESEHLLQTSEKEIQPSKLYTASSLLLRSLVATSALLVAVFYPDFHGLLTIVGTFFSFTVSAIFPCLVYLKLFQGRLSWAEKCLNGFILFLSGFMVLSGFFWVPLVDHIVPELE